MRLLILTALLAIALLACEKAEIEREILASNAVDFRNNGQSSSRCFNFQFTLTDVSLAGVCIPAPPGAVDPICGGGVPPTLVTIGNIAGTIRSVITGGSASGQGAVHYTLVHYFESADGQSTFWTDDHAVCAPINATQCRVNDVLNIVAGTGVFSNANGQFRNQGILDFATGKLSSQARGRICGDGL